MSTLSSTKKNLGSITGCCKRKEPAECSSPEPYSAFKEERQERAAEIESKKNQAQYFPRKITRAALRAVKITQMEKCFQAPVPRDAEFRPSSRIFRISIQR